LNYARNELAVAQRLFPPLDGTAAYRRMLLDITRESNEVMLAVVGDFAREHAGGTPARWTLDTLRERSELFKSRLLTERDAYVLRNQATLYAAIERERSVDWDDRPLPEMSRVG
jgi:hypothetical protein